jgi:hypothetical protein
MARLDYLRKRSEMAVEAYLMIYQLCGWEAPGEFRKLLGFMSMDLSSGENAIAAAVHFVRALVNFVTTSGDPLVYVTIGMFCFGMSVNSVYQSYRSETLETDYSMSNEIALLGNFHGLCVRALTALHLSFKGAGSESLGRLTYPYWNAPSVLVNHVSDCQGHMINESVCLPVLYLIGTHNSSSFVVAALAALKDLLYTSYSYIKRYAVVPFSQSACLRHHVPYPVYGATAGRKWQVEPSGSDDKILAYEDLPLGATFTPTTRVFVTDDHLLVNLDGARQKLEAGKRRRVTLAQEFKSPGHDHSTIRCGCGMEVMTGQGTPWYSGYADLRPGII